MPDLAEYLTNFLSLLLSVDFDLADVVSYRQDLVLELHLVRLGHHQSFDEALFLGLSGDVDVHHLMAFVCLIQYAVDAHYSLAVTAECLDFLFWMNPAFLVLISFLLAHGALVSFGRRL